MLVDRARRDAGRRHAREQLVDLARRHLGCGAVAERGHDVTGGRAGAATVTSSRLGNQVPMVGQGRRLRASHALEPVQVRVRDLPERRRSVRSAFRRGRPIGQLLLDLAHEPVLRDDRRRLVEEPELHAAAPPFERTVGSGGEPRRSEPALHRPQHSVRPAVPPTGVVEQLPLTSARDDQPRGRDGIEGGARRHRDTDISGRSSAGVALKPE
jgi:hypothetical protein